jgi:hypothetical protein
MLARIAMLKAMNHGKERVFLITGSAFVAILAVCLIGISFFAKSEQQAASAPTLKAGLRVATSDGGYVIMR